MKVTPDSDNEFLTTARQGPSGRGSRWRWAAVRDWCHAHPGEPFEATAVPKNAGSGLRKRFPELYVETYNYRHLDPENRRREVCDLYVRFDPPGEGHRASPAPPQ